MRSLIRFLINHHFSILFVVLEIVGFSLLFSYNSFHNAKLYSFRHAVVGRLSERFSNLSKYLELEKLNKELVKENEELYNKLLDSKYFLADESFVDSSTTQHYRYIPARVINNSVNKQYNLITINKGKLNGIQEDFGVIGPDGLVGVVKATSKHFSSVIPVLNREFFPNARIKNSNYFGFIEWDGNNYQHVTLKDIPLHAQIIIGDTIETSGYTTTFPEGIMIGTITDYETEKGVNYNIEVKLSTDFKKLTDVMVIQNLLKEEQLKLEDSVRYD